MRDDPGAHRLAAVMASYGSLIEEKVDVGLGRPFEAGSYFTNGVDLFRVVSVTSGSGGPRVVELEDCRTLELSLYAGDAVMTLGLTQVNPRRGKTRA